MVIHPNTLLLSALVSCLAGHTLACRAELGPRPCETEPSIPEARHVPSPTGNCPALVSGTVTFDVGGQARDVDIWLSSTAEQLDGPLIFFWHGLKGSPDDAEFVLGPEALEAILAEGGIVAAPHVMPGQESWGLVVDPTRTEDIDLADEVVGCAVADVGIDLSRIHSFGFSAGALHTSSMALLRSGYVASVVSLSGGARFQSETQNSENRFAALIMHGGPQDVAPLEFSTLSQAYAGFLADRDHCAVFLCDHDLGHKIPMNAGGFLWSFFSYYRFGVEAATPWMDSAGSSEGTLPFGCARLE